MQKRLVRKGLVIGIIILFLGACFLPNIITTKVGAKKLNEIEIGILNSPPTAPMDTSDTIVDRDIVLKGSVDAVILDNVPTSRWTYGCSPTTAGMLFGYYDRKGYKDMYTGPANDGVCPLTNLGQGIYSPIPGSCYIIATQQGHDLIIENGHVDDYWISTNSPGPDPWEGNWDEHTWGLCTADFMGTNQWKWDYYGSDGIKDSNSDGSTIYFYRSDGSKLNDYIPPAVHGNPRTAVCHGMKLFVKSRGYTVISNYNQLTDTPYGHSSGFTFNNFMGEINAGRPVVTHWVTSSGGGHSMLGVGYNPLANTIFIHDTWDNSLHEVSWDGSYSNYNLKTVSVIKLVSSGTQCPNTPSKPDGSTTCFAGETYTYSTSTIDPDGDQVSYGWDWNADGAVDEWTPLHSSGTTASTSHTWNSQGTYTIKVKAKDAHDAMSDWSDVLTVDVNGPPDAPIIEGEKNGDAGTGYEYSFTSTDPDGDDIAEYIVDWDDGTGEETITGPFASGTPATGSHTWAEEGDYNITAKAKDVNGLVGPEGTLEVTMPRVKNINTPFLNYLQNLLNNYPNLFPILQRLLKL